MRLAVFCPYLPAPAATGGRIRIARLVGRVAQAHELHLFAKAGPREAADAGVHPELDVFASRVSAPGRFDLPGLLAEAERVVSGAPRALLQAFSKTHRQRPFDGAIIEHAHAGRFASALGVPFVLDEHNIESRYLGAKLRAGRAPALFVRWQVRRLARFETRLWRCAARVIAVSSEEAAVVAARAGVAALVVPNGVDLAKVPYHPLEGRDPATVLFVGLMDHPPNVQAAVELARVVLPMVRKRVPHARLVLCGRNPCPEVLRLRAPQVEVTGHVTSVTPYFHRATVFANALRLGAGTSLKVVEALAAGTPLVSTRQGVRGFTGLTASEHYLHAETPHAFAQHVADVLRAPSAYVRMTGAGRKFAEAFGWEALGGLYLQAVEESLERAAGPKAER